MYIITMIKTIKCEISATDRRQRTERVDKPEMAGKGGHAPSVLRGRREIPGCGTR